MKQSHAGLGKHVPLQLFRPLDRRFEINFLRFLDQRIDDVRLATIRLLEQDPGLTRPQHQALKAAMLRRWHAKLALGDIS